MNIIIFIIHQQVPLPVPCVNFTQITPDNFNNTFSDM